MKMDENYIAQQFKRADEFFQAERYAAALEILRELNAIYPGDRNLLFPMARCLAALGQQREALETCEAILDIEDYEKARNLRDQLEGRHSSGKIDFTSSFSEMDSDLPVVAPTPIEMGEVHVPRSAGPPTAKATFSEPRLAQNEPWFSVVAISLLLGLVGFGILATAVYAKDSAAFRPTATLDVLLAAVIDFVVCTVPLYAMLHLTGLLRKGGVGLNILFACAGGAVIAAISISTYFIPVPAWADDLGALLVCSIYYRLPAIGILGYWSVALWCKVGLWSVLLTSFAQACLSLV